MKNANSKVLERSLIHASDFLSKLDEVAISPDVSYEDLRHKLSYPISENGIDPEQVIDELAENVKDGLLGSTSGRFFGWVIGGAFPVAIAADWLATAWDQNAAIAACSPSAAIVEEVSGEWLIDLLQIPKSASFGFVTGCQAAHITALAAARHKLLKDNNWDVEKKGLSGSPQIKLITSENRHESIIRATRLLGIGTDAIEYVACDASGSISLTGLEECINENIGQPIILCLQAGDLNTGAFDPYEKAIAMAKKANAWVHIDGAFGLWAAASSKYSHLLKGFEKADSWATDGHKWLNIPFDSGFVFVADPKAHSAALTQPVSYGFAVEGIRDQMNWNPEWSRRARGFSVYATIRSLGRKGIENLVNRCCKYTEQLVIEMSTLEGVEVLAKPIINQGLVRFIDPKGTDNDKFTDAVIDEIQKDGQTWFGGATWREKRVMRISVCNWRTTDEDINIAISSIKRCLELVKNT
jgi:glutamate/tyrosine decarboxylase-like PLP-dependent enzyme